MVAVVATVLIVEPWVFFGMNSYYDPSMVIAGNGAGTWLFAGYISYLVVGVVGTAVTALFYYYLEEVRGKVYRGIANSLAWAHLLLMNIGVAGASLLMMYGGYIGGYAAAPVSQGGLGLNGGQVHEQYLGQLVDPIGLLVLVACLGALLGGLGFVLTQRAERASPITQVAPG